MFEVEVKVRADHESVRPALETRDVTQLGSVEQVDTYYDAPHREFAETDEALRVRRERTGDDETVRLTYKGPLVDPESKTREEHETTVADGEAVEAVLAALGFDPAAEVRKERDRFELDGYTVVLDRVDGLGEFVEVETETSEADVTAARDGVHDLLETLGLDPDEGIRTSYLGLSLADRDSRE
jgi:adenylate cyclase class 2